MARLLTGSRKDWRGIRGGHRIVLDLTLFSSILSQRVMRVRPSLLFEHGKADTDGRFESFL